MGKPKNNETEVCFLPQEKDHISVFIGGEGAGGKEGQAPVKPGGKEVQTS